MILLLMLVDCIFNGYFGPFGSISVMLTRQRVAQSFF